MKRLLYVLTGLCLLAGLFTACEKPLNEPDDPNGGGSTSTEQFASIQGKVTDKKTGSPLSTVTITLQLGNKRVQTAEDGTYILENLKAGIYTMKVQKEGYVTYTKEEIQLADGQILRLDIEMQEDEYKEKSDYVVTMYGLNMEMVYVEGGTFEMGASDEQGEDAREDEYPERAIKLDAYHIGKYEVTQAQWKAVMGTEPSYFKGENLPVEQVSWDEAQEFCKRLSEATGRKYTLPTEAQWEYAARGGNKSQHFKYAGSNNINEVAWYKINSNSKTHPVGGKKANELGVYDMSGNVWEWCSDWYTSYDASNMNNPQGAVNGEERVDRGGCWCDLASNCRVSSRDYDNPDLRYSDLGFRVVCLAE